MVTLPSLPQFTLHELREGLDGLNPTKLLVEVYDATIGEWVITPVHSPITLLTGVKVILLSLRPSALEQFQSRPGLEELLDLFPRARRSPGTPSKRTAAGELISPRRHKVPRHDSLVTLMLDSTSSSSAVPTPGSNETISTQPPLASVIPQLNPPSPPPTTHPLTPAIPSSPTVQEKKGRFPSHFPACDVLSKVSKYLEDQNGNHGSFLTILKEICKPHTIGKTTAAKMADDYKYNHPHFMGLDRDLQQTITWSELGRRAKAANTPATDTFTTFIDPTHSPMVSTDLHIVGSMPSTVTVNPTTPATPTAITDQTHPTTPAAINNRTHSTIPGVIVEPTLSPPLPRKIPHVPVAPFPIDLSVLQPLPPKQRAVLDAEYDLIRAISKDLVDIDPTLLDDLTGQGIGSKLQCPFCSVELPGTECSPALMDLLNSKFIQDNTEPDPTLQNPNARRSLRGHQVYSNFCSQHRLEELLIVAKAAGWPYPPDFVKLRDRIHSKGVNINAFILGIREGVRTSRFYSEVLRMSGEQRREQSQDIVAAG